MPKQLTTQVLMVRPANFGFNPETAASNAFQQDDAHFSVEEIKTKAIAEFDAFVDQLQNAAIEVIVFQDDTAPIKTDAVFPNNWMTTHHDGTLILYPMLSENRRLERNPAIIEQLGTQFRISRTVDLTIYEEQQRFLEGTGSMVLDREHKIVYACRSARTDELVLEMFCQATGFHPHLFLATDGLGQPIYHTNVMMALGAELAIVCLAAIQDKKERQHLVDRLTSTGKTIVEITLVQMMAFAGNMIQVANTQGQSYFIMSSAAYGCLKDEQIQAIEQHAHILHSDLETIEAYGGGSARCMIAEIFLPTRR